MENARFKKLLQAIGANIRECLFSDKENPSEWLTVSYTAKQQERGEFSVSLKNPKVNRSGEEVLAQFGDYGSLIEIRKRFDSTLENYVFRIKSERLDNEDSKELIKVIEMSAPREVKGKMNNEQYIKAAEDFLSGKYLTKKAVADAYGVDATVITDMFNPKYVRKSCSAEIEALKKQYSHQ